MHGTGMPQKMKLLDMARFTIEMSTRTKEIHGQSCCCVTHDNTDLFAAKVGVTARSSIPLPILHAAGEVSYHSWLCHDTSMK